MVATEAATVVERAAVLAEEFAARAGEHDRSGSFPFENFAALDRAGLLSLTVPEEFGGQGLGLADVCRVVGQIARGDASTALVLAMHCIHHAILARGRRWPPAVYERICRESVAGVALINVMRVEPELGTPARGGMPATVATPTADGWRLTGHKLYATGSPLLRYFIVLARTAGEQPQVGYFLVPADTPGLRIVETWDHLGMRATGSHDLVLEDVAIPRRYGVDLRPLAAWTPDPATAGWNALTLTALYHGVACAARDWLATYLHQRVPANLGAPLATLPRFQSAVGEIEALLYANERLIYGLAEEIDRAGSGAAPGAQPSLVKYIATTNAIRAVDIALSLVGNPGLSRTHPLERHHRDLLCSRIHTPQDDMITLAAGKAALARAPGAEH